MRIQVLGASGGECLGSSLTCLLINETIALDAGSLAGNLSLDAQAKVRSIVLSHSHMDHIASLPFLIENVFGSAPGPIEIYASAPTIYAVRKNLFNNEVWPDFSRIPNHLLPSVRFHELTEEEPVVIDGVTFTPIPVQHVVPTFGFLIQHEGSAMLWSSDTGPTQRLWEIANATPDLKLVGLEVSFDNSLQHIADISDHLTPNTVDQELAKLEVEVPVLLHHLKPPCAEAIQREVAHLGRSNLGFLEEGKTYEI
ncbi:MAG: 3',5'-cyclic-nucleotide phosphodiesterase [Acidobacteriota bacterium]